MITLVVVILAGLVMLAAALVGMAYVGPLLTDGAARGVTAHLLQVGAQVAGAETLYEAESAGVALVDEEAGSAIRGLVAGGYLAAEPAIPTSVARKPWGWVVRTQGAAAAGAPPYLALPLDPASPATERVCAMLADQANMLFGCVGDLTRMSPYRDANGLAREVFFYYQKVSRPPSSPASRHDP